jgi:hypothetical protein
MQVYSINTIIFKNIIEYQYSESDELWNIMQISHAYDMQELVDISNEIYKCQSMNFTNVYILNEYKKIMNKANIIFNQYGYPIHTWTSFYTIKL